MLFFIEHGSRKVHVAGVTACPTGPWVTQQARQLAWTIREWTIPAKWLIRDRDAKFTTSFDEVFRSEGMQVIRIPARAPRANAIAERFVGTVRQECLDRMIILSRRHLVAVLHEFVGHYNTRRPHQSLDQKAPVYRRRPKRDRQVQSEGSCEPTWLVASFTNTGWWRDADEILGTHRCRVRVGGGPMRPVRSCSSGSTATATATQVDPPQEHCMVSSCWRLR